MNSQANTYTIATDANGFATIPARRGRMLLVFSLASGKGLEYWHGGSGPSGTGILLTSLIMPASFSHLVMGSALSDPFLVHAVSGSADTLAVHEVFLAEEIIQCSEQSLPPISLGPVEAALEAFRQAMVEP